MSIRTCSLPSCLPHPAFADDKADWKPLFNGKNLDGWMPKITGYDYGDNFGAFRVEDGLLKVATTNTTRSARSSAISFTRISFRIT